MQRKGLLWVPFVAVCVLNTVPISAITLTLKCGNGWLEPGEGCDDGNNFGGDGCNTFCQLEDPCGCSQGDEFICSEVSVGIGKAMTVCCPTLVHPVTHERVCHCGGPNSTEWLTTLAVVDQSTCELLDVDECAGTSTACAPNAVCVNLDGRNVSKAAWLADLDNRLGFRCECPLGLFGDGYESCEPSQLLAEILFVVENTTGGAGFHYTTDNIVVDVKDFLSTMDTLDALSVVKDVYARYVDEADVDWLQSPTSAGRRRLLQAPSVSGSVVAVVFEAANYDALQQIVSEVNGDSLALFLQTLTSQLNQISLLQSATAVVDDSGSSFTELVLSSPGFGVHSFTYTVEPATPPAVDDVFLWKISATHFAPLDVNPVLFVSKSSAGDDILNQDCVVSPDVCCLLRFANSHYVSDVFMSRVSLYVQPWCELVDGLYVPNATAAGMPSSEVLAGFLADTVWGDFVADAVAPPYFARSRVLLPDTTPGAIEIELAQGDIASLFSVTDVTGADNATRYNFAVGMLFFRASASTQLMFTEFAQVRLQVLVSPSMTVAVTTEQEYSFLDSVDVTFYEIEYVTENDGLRRLQYAMMSFNMPFPLSGGSVETTSIQYALGSSADAFLDPASLSWVSACYSAENPAQRDGTGIWDFNNGTRGMLSIASERACALGGYDNSFCAAATVPELYDYMDNSHMFYVDVPIGDDVAPFESLVDGAASYIFLRMVVHAVNTVPDALQATVGAATMNVSSLVSLQMQFDRSHIITMCESPMVSVLRDIDYVHTTLTIGTNMLESGTNPVEFSNVADTPLYRDVTVLDASELYKAASVIDSLLTFVLSGSQTFFSVNEHLSYSVRLDHAVLVHVRDTAVFDTLQFMVNNGTAFSEVQNADGFKQVDVSADFMLACVGEALAAAPGQDKAGIDCVVRTVVVNGVIAHEGVAHEVSADIDDDLLWLLLFFGDTPFMRDFALEFATSTRTRYGLDARYKRAWWISPAYAWPDQTTSQMSERTMLFTSYSVAH